MRIISLVPSHTEILFYLGLGGQVIGVTEHCDFPPEAGSRERVGHFGSPDIEKIVALEPDLVVAGGSVHREQVARLRQAGIAVFDFQPRSVAALLDGMEELLKITGSQANNSRVGLLRAKKHDIEELAAKSMRRPRLAFLMGGSTITVPGPANWQYDTFKICGTQPLSAAGEVFFHHVAMEEIAEFDPEILLACGRRQAEPPRPRCPGCSIEDRPCIRDIASIRQNPVFSGVAAVRSGQVYPVACHLFCRPGPRLFEGMEWLASLVNDLG